MNRCSLPFEVIVDYAEGKTDAAATGRVRRHLDRGCTTCQKNLAWVQAFLPALHTAAAEPEFLPSEAARDYVRSLARERPVAAVRPSLPVRIAQLLFNNRQTPALSGARGLDGQASRSLFATDTHFIDLWEEQTQEGLYYLIGQALPRSGGDPLLPESVLLLKEEGGAFPAKMEGTEFHMPSVPGGTYQLRVRMGEEEILVPAVAVGV